MFATLGKAGLLGLPFPERYGGGGQPYEVYLQVLEEIGARWASVGVGVSVQALTCFPLLNYGTEQQRERWLPELIGGDLLGAYCLSEPDAGSDPGAMRTRATRTERRLAASTGPRPGSPTAGRRTSTRCSPAPARAPAGSAASSSRPTRPGSPRPSRSRRWA